MEKFTHKNILVVEDYIIDQVLILRIIEEVYGVDVTVDIVTDAFLAIRLLKSIKYDRMILDYDLSLGIALDVLKYLSSNQNNIQIGANSIIPENNDRMVKLYPNLINVVLQKDLKKLKLWLKVKKEKS